MMIIFEPKAYPCFLSSFFLAKTPTLIRALIKLIPTPVYRTRWDGVKNVSGVLSRCAVISQLAPHTERVTPTNATKYDASEILEYFPTDSFSIFNYLISF